jgi:hypothetical protein
MSTITMAAVAGRIVERKSRHVSPLLCGSLAQREVAAACVLFGLGSGWPLLAWVSFAAWYWASATPGLVFIAATGVVVERRGAWTSLRVALTAGALGGLAGTVTYDVARAPAGSHRLPIVCADELVRRAYRRRKLRHATDGDPGVGLQL